jgi:hypothetical protein
LLQSLFFSAYFGYQFIKKNKIMEDFFEKISTYFRENPGSIGYLFIIFGIVFMYGAYKDWGWIFEGGGRTINIEWISDTFGRKTARNLMILLGLFFVFGGGFWIYVNSK